MEKIIVVGCPGAGKTTFARQLSEKLHIPLHHLDAHFWRENWTHPSEEEFKNIQSQLMQEPRWVIDGHFRKSVSHRIAHADTIILFDFPKVITLWRTFKRFLQYRGGVRPDMGGNNKETLQWQHIRYILKFKRKAFAQSVETLASGKQLIVFRNSTEVADFLTSL